MLLDQRRNQILEYVEEKGYTSLQQLVEHVGVSESTIRRDLEYFDSLGQLRRTRGGVAYVGESALSIDVRACRARREKQIIAKKVAEMIEPGESILLDAGSTTLEIAHQISKMTLQVVTTCLPIANLLWGAGGIELIFIGGYLHPKTGVALGPIVTQTLAGLNVRKAIMSAGGLTEKGLFNSNTLLVDAQRLMIQAADEVIVALDSQKLGQTELVRLCPLQDIDHLVIDQGIDETWKRTLEKAGVHTVVAGADGA